MSTLRFASVNADGLLADLDLPPAAYRALLKLRAMSEAAWADPYRPGHDRPGTGTQSPQRQRGSAHPGAGQAGQEGPQRPLPDQPDARGLPLPEDAVAAVQAMPKDERLDARNFVLNYRQAVAAYEDQLAEKRRRKDDQKRRQVFKAVS